MKKEGAKKEECVSDGIFAGTFLGPLADIIAKGDFKDIEDQLAKGEKIIGDQTPLEKGIYALSHRMIEELAKICEPCPCTEKERASAKCAKVKKKVKKIKEQLEALHSLFWRLIEERLNFDGHLGVRHGFKIVKLPPSPERPRIMVTSVIGQF